MALSAPKQGSAHSSTLSRLKRWELHDVEADRTEAKDLVARYPNKVKELAGAYDRRAEGTGHVGEPPHG